MTISIVIVSYNVSRYLRQCLTALYASNVEAQLEVLVVDNASIDDSVAMLRQCFPQVHLIANSHNPGFAAANNQALPLAHGDYIVLLNPDTILQEDALQLCLSHLQSHPQCGAAGLMMLDGEGRYLRESKRGFPTPQASFFKLSGLIRLFPRHPRIAAYYRGDLPDNQPANIDILPGAFIMLSRQALIKVGLLDESYFMFGEDIDYSWRIRLAGYHIAYLPSARMLHYKGESTQRSSLNYVRTFYNAMAIFVRHYFGGTHARLYNMLIHIAIRLRATLAMLWRILRRSILPLADALLSFASFLLVKNLWSLTLGIGIDYYPPHYTTLILPLYALLIVIVTLLSGGYDKPVSLSRIAKGQTLGACMLLLFYSLLDESLRYSRAVVLFGSLLTILCTILLRRLIDRLGTHRLRHILIVGDTASATKAQQLLHQLDITPSTLATLAPSDLATTPPSRITADTIIFCTPSTPTSLMLTTMQQLSPRSFFTAPSYDTILIGPSITLHPDELYLHLTFTIATPTARRNKRLFDIATSLLALLLTPLLLPLQHTPSNYLRHCLAVLKGKATWVGYNNPDSLPPLPTPILTTRHRLPPLADIDTHRLDLDYAQHYSTTTDATILLRNWRNI